MKFRKMIIGLFLSTLMLIMTAFSANAATYTGGNVINNVMTKTPTSISYTDIMRLVEIATETNGKQASIVNATRYNDSPTTWIVRMCYGGNYENAGDYVLTVLPYSIDTTTSKVLSLPFNTVEEGTQMFGPSWYYFGVFDDVSHNICGFILAERFKRWPDWKDKAFAGITKRNIGYSGTYPEESSLSFLEEHMEQEIADKSQG